MKNDLRWLLLLALVFTATCAAAADTPAVPEWALPGSTTHQQVSPPADFHRAARTLNESMGIFDAQSDVRAGVLSGHSRHDSATGRYTITSAGYNIW